LVGSRNDCPSREQLAAYTAGKLPSAALEVVAEHVAGCPACQSSLAGAQVVTEESDSLIGKLRRCVAPTAPIEPPFDDPEKTAPQTVRDKRPLTSADTRATGAAPGKGALRAFGQYELLEEIGHGGMGVVYKARQTRLNRLVAIKMIRAGAYAGAGERARFCVEGEAVARLQHPHVIQVHEFNEHDGQFYLCMELLEGGNLAGKLTDTGLPVREAAQLVQALAGALHVAHQRHIIHRDLKPGNVLLTADGTPKISDFGLAKLLDTEGGQTAPDAVVGTPSYMAPEQAEGKTGEVGPLADVYALGAILYQALTGRPPFKGATRLETLYQVRTAAAVPPTRLRGGIPRDLEAICLKCLEKAPAQRYASAEALADDLGRWLRGEPTRARPLRWYARAWRRAPRRALAVGLVVLVGLASALLYAWRTAPSPERTIQQIEARAARGEAVTLIDETGRPAWSRWRTGEDSSQTSLAGDGAFAVHSWGLALLELVRDPQVERYRIRAEVRHQNCDDLGAVGLFFGLRDYPIGGDVLYFFVRVAFDDVKDMTKKALLERPPGLQLPPPPKGNPVHLGPRLYAEGKPRPLWDEGIGDLAPRLFDPAGANGGPWRPLVLDVTPEGVRGTWGDKASIGALSAKGIEKDIRFALASMRTRKPQGALLAGINPKFSPRGGLGLYVYKGVASFRRVVIEPAPQKGKAP
jgi:serine/threonine-protein kinase